MSIIFLFMKRWWKELIVVIAIAAVVLHYRSLTSTIEDQRVSIATLTNENTIIKQNNEKLEQAIVASNKSIELLAAGTSQTKKDFATLNKAVKGQASDLEVKLRGILAEAPPQSCEDTIKYLVDAVKGYPK